MCKVLSKAFEGLALHNHAGWLAGLIQLIRRSKAILLVRSLFLSQIFLKVLQIFVRLLVCLLHVYRNVFLLFNRLISLILRRQRLSRPTMLLS